MGKNIFGRNIYVHSKFSCMLSSESSHNLCALTHAHNLEETFYSPLWVSHTGSVSDWHALQEALYKCIDTIQYNIACGSALSTYGLDLSANGLDLSAYGLDFSAYSLE